ncbi:MAG TPA: DMT family transporter [Blastocatellia bacterium]|nr:DMT family transporter [Blastocatellia bacterium]
MNSVTHERRRAVILLIIAALLWSTGGLLIKLVSWHPFAIAGMRSAIAAVVLLAAVRRPRITWSATQLGCALAYAGTVVMFAVANKHTTAANAILLQYTAPVYIALFGAWFLGERTTRLDWITIFLVLVGMTLFLFDGLRTGNWLGNGLALASAASFASLVVLLRKQKDSSPIESVILGNVIAALVGLPFMFGEMPDAKSWVGLVLLGVFQLGLSYLIYVRAVKSLTALEAILIPVIEPLLNPLWVMLQFGEKPTGLALIGGIIVLGSVTARGVISNLLRKPSTSF